MGWFLSITFDMENKSGYGASMDLDVIALMCVTQCHTVTYLAFLLSRQILLEAHPLDLKQHVGPSKLNVIVRKQADMRNQGPVSLSLGFRI